MRPPESAQDDFVFDFNETAALLGTSVRTAQDHVSAGTIAHIKAIGEESGKSQNWMSKGSILAYLKKKRKPVNLERARATITDPEALREFEEYNRSVFPSSEAFSEVPRERSERVPSPQGVEIVSELRERLAEKDERIADLQTRLDETQGKYETILVESGEKQQALLLQRVGVEKALSGMIYKAQKAEPQLRFIEQKDDRGVIVDVEVVKDASKPFPWAYVWGAISTITLLGIGTYLALTYRLLG